MQFLKYLPHFSWIPFILTSKGSNYFSYDSALAKNLPDDIKIFRASTPSSLLRKFKPDAGVKASPNRNRKPSKKKAGNFSGTWGKVYEFFNKWVGIPDAFIQWAPFASLKGIHIIKKSNIDVIYSTGPPFSNHMVATVLKKITGKPMVTDFRDAWFADPMRRWRDSKVRLSIESFLEAKVIRNSDIVISTTEGISQDFRNRYPSEPESKFIVITNGYDRENLQNIKKSTTNRSKKMRIVHTGYMSMERTPKFFLKALRALFIERPDLENRIEVFFIGENGVFTDGRYTEEYIRQYKLDHSVTLTGPVSYLKAKHYQITSNILLLLIGIVPKEKVITYGIASKIFDYMIAEKPVLAITDDGPVSRLIEKTKIGTIVKPTDVLGIKNFLSSTFDHFTKGQLNVTPCASEVNKYNIEALTGRLSQVLDGISVSIG